MPSYDPRSCLYLQLVNLSPDISASHPAYWKAGKSAGTKARKQPGHSADLPSISAAVTLTGLPVI
jgi:hypothetical protein